MRYGTQKHNTKWEGEDSFCRLTQEELAEEQELDMDEDEDFGMKM